MDHSFASGGEMGALMDEVDWSQSSIGPPDAWPQALRTAASICLESRFPMLLWWGERLTMVYNDAYRVILGRKHPRAMGRDGAAAWPETWDALGPVLDGVLHRGEATWSADQELLIDRNGVREEAYFTFSHSPIRDGEEVAGVFTTVSETTEQVVGARRLTLLRALAGTVGGRRDERAFLEAVEAVLTPPPADLPFAVLYLFERERTAARRVLSRGATAAGGDEVDLAATGRVADVLARVAATQGPVVVDDLAGRFVPDGRGPRPTRALATPVRALGAREPLGVLVAGVNPRRPVDTAHEEFFELVAGTLASGLADARATEAERERAQALAALSAARTEFLANVSHEFRTPLTLLLGPLEEALDDVEDPLEGAQRERAEMAHRNALRLRKLVDGLLELTRSQAGGSPPRGEAVDLAQGTTELGWGAEAEAGPDAGAAADGAPAGGADRPRVLLVDGTADLRAYVGRLLAGAYLVEAVPDGERALERATADPPDLVLSGVRVPGLDGLALLRALRADARTARIPVVLLSARAGTEASVEALDAGADDYLVKPFSAAELLARVRANVALGRLRESATRAAEERYDREHALVEELQRSLLPEGLPVLPEVEVAARYLPAEGDKAVGGDWYDVLRLPDERIMVVVGDVVGHGMQAAATMAHLRTATRAFAGEGHEPGELVHRVSRLVERTGVGLGSTLLLAVLDADTGDLEYASAGHPPALVTGPDGPRWLAFGLAPPLGLASTSDPRAELDLLHPDETLVLFTDGLVERRGEDLEDRLRQLAAVAAPDGAPAGLIDALVGEMTVAGRRDDDVALLAVRRVPARATLALDLAADADLGELREELRAWLGRAQVDADVRDEVLLVACEAVINAVEHGGVDAGDVVAVRGQAYDDRLRLVIRDRGRWRRQGPVRARGYGLRIIRALMDEVSLDVDGEGTRLEVSRELVRS